MEGVCVTAHSLINIAGRYFEGILVKMREREVRLSFHIGSAARFEEMLARQVSAHQKILVHWGVLPLLT